METATQINGITPTKKKDGGEIKENLWYVCRGEKKDSCAKNVKNKISYASLSSPVNS